MPVSVLQFKFCSLWRNSSDVYTLMKAGVCGNVDNRKNVHLCCEWECQDENRIVKPKH